MRRAVIALMLLVPLLAVILVFAVLLGRCGSGYLSTSGGVPDPPLTGVDDAPVVPTERRRTQPDRPASPAEAPSAPVTPPPVGPDTPAVLVVDVVRVDGTPVGGAQVAVRPWIVALALTEASEPTWTAETDGDGRARLEIPPPQHVDLRVALGAEASFPETVNLPASTETYRRVVLAPALALSGVVLDPDGRRVVRPSITLWCHDADGLPRSLTGRGAADGTFRFPVLPASALATVRVTAYILPERAEDVATMAVTSFDFTRAELEADPYLELRLRAETIRGRCVDAAGAPVRDVWIHLGENEKPRAHTGADGRFEFDAAPEPDTPLLVRSDAYVPRRLVLPVVKGGADRDFGDIVLDRGEPLSGRVVRADGSAVQQAFVRLAVDGLGDAYPRLVTGPDGRFTFAHVPAGSHVVHATWPTGRPCLPVAIRTDVAAGGPAAELVLPDIRWMRLQLVDAAGTRLRIPRVTVRVRRTGKKAEPAVAGSVWTGGSEQDAGFVQVPGTGTYDVEVDAPGYQPARRPGVAIGRDADETTVVELTLRPARR